MAAADVNVYEACDRAIQQMNREIVEDFGKLKLAKFDQVNVIKTVLKVYRDSAKRAKKRYYGVAFEAYLLGLYLGKIEGKKAHQMAEKAITNEWVEDVLNETDFITLYQFYPEMERKAYRLAEALSAAESRDQEIDKAMRLWSKQLGQYAINVTDYAMVQAFEDAGVKMLEWITANDERVCNECYALDGQVFRVNEVPRKPHWGCRCHLKPVFRTEEG